LHVFAGASAETHAKNRQELYEVSKALEQAAKKRQAVAAKQGHKGSAKHRSSSKAGSSAALDQAGSSAVHTSAAVSKKHKGSNASASANGHAVGSVESPGTSSSYCVKQTGSSMSCLCTSMTVACIYSCLVLTHCVSLLVHCSHSWPAACCHLVRSSADDIVDLVCITSIALFCTCELQAKMLSSCVEAACCPAESAFLCWLCVLLIPFFCWSACRYICQGSSSCSASSSR